MSETYKKLIDKVIINADLTVLTGMHIGASTEFSSIGAVDSVVIRDPLNKRPIIPGSSIKGKLRFLLARALTEKGYITPFEEEPDEVKRLFGSSRNGIVVSRLQFTDLFMDEESADKIEKMDTDLYLTEIKFENTIDRATGIANPRQIERVPRGSKFCFRLIYNIENIDEMETDFKNLSTAISLLHLDYLGGNGTRGYGRVKISNFKLELAGITDESSAVEINKYEEYLKGAERYASLFV